MADLPQLRAFLAVVDALHFGHAADSLHIAQPHLSRVIRSLEQDLGARLFDRTTRRVELTNAGLSLVGPANKILATMADARSAVSAASRGDTGLVRLGFAGPSSQAAVGQISCAVREAHPGISLAFKPGRYGSQIIENILDGSIDLAMVHWYEVPTTVRARPITAERYVVAVPETHRFAGRKSIALRELRDDAFVTLPDTPDSSVNMAFRSWCRRSGFDPSIIQTAPDTWTILALVAAGTGAAFTVESALEHSSREGISVLQLDDVSDLSFSYLMWMPHSQNVALRNVLAVAKTIFPSLEPSKIARD